MKRNPVSNDTGNEYAALRAIEKRNFKTHASGYDCLDGSVIGCGLAGAGNSLREGCRQTALAYR
jgi:hypothetical protein